MHHPLQSPLSLLAPTGRPTRGKPTRRQWAFGKSSCGAFRSPLLRHHGPASGSLRLGTNLGSGTREFKTPRQRASIRGRWHGACSEYFAGGSGVLTYREFTGVLGLAPRPGMRATSDRPTERQFDEAIVEERRDAVVRLL